ncbi:MAG: response regulator [Magnetospirillum sp. WYHS-4]
MGAIKALVVDDNRLNRELLSGQLAAMGYEISTASDGAEAWDFLRQAGDTVDVVLLDRRMPNMDGMELLGRMKADAELSSIPVIMQTAADSQQEIVEGIKAGVFYYLTKPFEPAVLLSITAAAVEDYARFCRLRRDVEQRTQVLGLMQSSLFRFRSMKQGADLAAVLAAACPNPRKRVIGLSELLANAVEHGNLGITYEEKSTLIAERRLDQEVESRLAAPANRDKAVEVLFERQPDRIAITVKDQGVGFDWRKYLEMDPRRVFDSHGRGIALARNMSFDSLEYRGCGNEVVATVMTPSEKAG